MKKVILLLATILLTVGCNQKQKEQVASQESKPQLTAAEKRNMEIQDSLKKAKTDSLALIAWGDAKFGMSMKEALATEAFKGGDKYSNSITMDFDKKSKLGNAIGLSMFMILETEFKENELYLIRIENYIIYRSLRQ